MAPTAPTTPGGLQVRAVHYGRAMSPQQQITEEVQQFLPTDPVHVSVEIAGRPRAGTLKFRWDVFGEEASASVDLSSVNGGVLFSVGQSTFVGGTLSHQNPLPIAMYETVLEFNGAELGRYPFVVGPPTDATPSTIHNVVTARNHTEDYHPIDPATTFGATDPVHLLGCGTFGRLTWVQVKWLVGGTFDESATRELTFQENVETCVGFGNRPAQGWPLGEHTAILTMNGHEIGRYPFTIRAPNPG